MFRGCGTGCHEGSALTPFKYRDNILPVCFCFEPTTEFLLQLDFSPTIWAFFFRISSAFLGHHKLFVVLGFLLLVTKISFVTIQKGLVVFPFRLSIPQVLTAASS
jgi:hypothetical protein